METKASSESDAQQTTIDQLNDDCLQNIFIKLPVPSRLCLEIVCKRWRDVGQQCWSDVREVSLYHHERDHILKEIWKYYNTDYTNSFELDADYTENLFIRCGRFLTNLEISKTSSDYKEMDRKIIQLASMHCYNLKTLKLRLFYYEPMELDVLLHQCASTLETVEIYSYESQFDWESRLQNLSKTKIKELVLKNDFECIWESYASVISEFRNLQKLELWSFFFESPVVRMTDNHTLTHLSIRYSFIAFSITECFGKLPNLEHLSLYYIGLNHDHLYYSISVDYMKLKFLRLEVCGTLSNSNLSDISNIPTLEILELKRIHHIEGDGLAMMTNLKVFRCIKCEDMREEKIIGLLENAPNLELVDVAYATNVTTEILKAANRITRLRHNGIVMNIEVPLHIKNMYNAETNDELSPYLKITGIDGKLD